MRKLISTVVLISLLLACYCPVRAIDSNVESGPVIIDENKHVAVEKLIDLRGKLILDYENNVNEISKIDEQLALLGVEKLSSAEFAKKLGYSVAPQMIPESQQYVQHLSERLVTVWNGQRYEVQIVTSQPTHRDSVLQPDEYFTIKSEDGIQASQQELVKVMAFGTISHVGGAAFSSITTGVSIITTAYDAYKSISELLTPVSIVEGVSGVGMISMTITERHYFIKYEGAVDDGNQILGCVANRVEYVVGVMSEGDLIVDGVSQASIKDFHYENSISSQHFEKIYSGVGRSAEMFWKYKNTGLRDFQTHFLVNDISIDVAGGKTLWVDIPYNGLGFA